MLHVNCEFCLHMATRFRPGGRFLDYGCGGGQVVLAGRQRNLDIYGSEVFFGGGPSTGAAAESTGLLGTSILPMDNGRLPFPDEHFDFVFHNQVFEHVPDIDLALKEIFRVLKRTGLMLSIFPPREILWDGHCGIPFIHWSCGGRSRENGISVDLVAEDRGRKGSPSILWRKIEGECDVRRSSGGRSRENGISVDLVAEDRGRMRCPSIQWRKIEGEWDLRRSRGGRSRENAISAD